VRKSVTLSSDSLGALSGQSRKSHRGRMEKAALLRPVLYPLCVPVPSLALHLLSENAAMSVQKKLEHL